MKEEKHKESIKGGRHSDRRNAKERALIPSGKAFKERRSQFDKTKREPIRKQGEASVTSNWKHFRIVAGRLVGEPRPTDKVQREDSSSFSLLHRLRPPPLCPNPRFYFFFLPPLSPAPCCLCFHSGAFDGGYAFHLLSKRRRHRGGGGEEARDWFSLLLERLIKAILHFPSRSRCVPSPIFSPHSRTTEPGSSLALSPSRPFARQSFFVPTRHAASSLFLHL